MSIPKMFPLLFLCGLAACASQAPPEDASMTLALGTQGKTLLAEGKNAEARDIYLSAVARDDQNARAWNGLGVANDLLGKRNEAREAYRRALDLAPRDYAALNNLAHLYLEEGDAASAAGLLAPFANDKDAPPALKQNFADAAKAAEAQKPYADLGSFSTEGMAQGRSAKARASLEDMKNLSFFVIPEIKEKGGTPVFTVKATGEDPQSVCRKLNAEDIRCVPHGKK